MPYRISKPRTIEYEWNKGPMPSGFAGLRLCVQPNILPGEEEIRIRAATNLTSKIRPTEYAKKQPKEKLKRYVPAYTEMAMEGIRTGSYEALADFLDQRVVGIEVIVEEVVFDLVFSTKMAFHMAAKVAINQLLMQAKEEGFLNFSQ